MVLTRGIQMSELINILLGKAFDLVSQYALNSAKNLKKKNLWENAVKKACEASKGLGNSFYERFIELPSIQRHFLWLISKKKKDGVYRSFIITLAVELCTVDLEKEYAESLGMAILDEWFESNDEDYQEIRNQIAGEDITEIINDREMLYREFFMLYSDSLAKDTIRVYYPRNGEKWIEWDKRCSVDVKVNLFRGTEFGFYRIGCAYRKIGKQDYEKDVIVAYLNKGREIAEFTYEALYGLDEDKILYVL